MKQLFQFRSGLFSYFRNEFQSQNGSVIRSEWSVLESEQLFQTQNKAFKAKKISNSSYIVLVTSSENLVSWFSQDTVIAVYYNFI